MLNGRVHGSTDADPSAIVRDGPGTPLSLCPDKRSRDQNPASWQRAVHKLCTRLCSLFFASSESDARISHQTMEEQRSFQMECFTLHKTFWVFKCAIIHVQDPEAKWSSSSMSHCRMDAIWVLSRACPFSNPPLRVIGTSSVLVINCADVPKSLVGAWSPMSKIASDAEMQVD